MSSLLFFSSANLFEARRRQRQEPTFFRVSSGSKENEEEGGVALPQNGEPDDLFSSADGRNLRRNEFDDKLNSDEKENGT